MTVRLNQPVGAGSSGMQRLYAYDCVQSARSSLHLPPPFADLVRRRGAGHADLLNRDRRDQVAERRGLLEGGPGHDGTGDPGTGAVPGPDDVGRPGHRIGGDVVRRRRRGEQVDPVFAAGLEDVPAERARANAAGPPGNAAASRCVRLHADVLELADAFPAVGQDESSGSRRANSASVLADTVGDDAAIPLAHLVEDDQRVDLVPARVEVFE